MRKKILIFGLIIICVVGGLIGIRLFILGNATLVDTQHDSLPAQVSQGLREKSSNTPDISNATAFGTNYQIDSTKYFDSRTWAVVRIVPTGQNATDPALVVMHLDNNQYQIVVGPGTSFSSDSLQNVPADVAQYLRSIGIVYTQE